MGANIPILDISRLLPTLKAYSSLGTYFPSKEKNELDAEAKVEVLV